MLKTFIITIIFLYTSILHITGYSITNTQDDAAINDPTSSFNPKMSLILDGQYTYLKHKPDEYKLPGFGLGGEAGLYEQGFSLGHSEIILSANADDKFYGQLTFVMEEHDGESHNKIEESFFKKMKRTHDDLKLVTSLMKRYKSIDECLKRGEHFSNLSFDALKIFRPSAEKNILQNIVSFCINRNY